MDYLDNGLNYRLGARIENREVPSGTDYIEKAKRLNLW